MLVRTVLTTPRRAAAVLSLVVGLALALTGCEKDDPPDLTGLVFAPECDPSVTITFDSGETAVVNRNHCEGYGPDQWDYVLDDEELTMAPMGRLDDPMAVKETFQVSQDAQTLTFTGSTSFFACGNCVNGDQWLRQ